MPSMEVNASLTHCGSVRLRTQERRRSGRNAQAQAPGDKERRQKNMTWEMYQKMTWEIFQKKTRDIQNKNWEEDNKLKKRPYVWEEVQGADPGSCRQRTKRKNTAEKTINWKNWPRVWEEGIVDRKGSLHGDHEGWGCRKYERRRLYTHTHICIYIYIYAKKPQGENNTHNVHTRNFSFWHSNIGDTQPIRVISFPDYIFTCFTNYS